jgi:hypothetical protein
MAGSSQQMILDYNSNIVNWAAVFFLAKLFAPVPGLFKLIQGGSSWTAALRTEEGVAVPVDVAESISS